MNMAKLKNPNGRSMRADFTFFEINALKRANELCESRELHAGDPFLWGESNETFTVLEFTPDRIAILRDATGRRLEALRIEASGPENGTGAAGTDKDIPDGQKSVKRGGNGRIRADNTADVAAKIAEALAGLNTGNGNTAEPVDYERIRQMIEETVAEQVKGTGTRISVNGLPEVRMDGIMHGKFKEALFWAANRQPVYLYGPAGTGKNVLAEQVAKALGLPFYYAGSLQFKTDLEGFVNAAGEYVETDFYRAFTEGGVFLLDEVDATAAEVLVAFGACLANRYYNFPKHGKLEAHSDFVVFASGNTAGRGATETYNGRFQLDASTLDRFAFIPMDYDRRIELANAGGDEILVDFAHELRAVIGQCGLTYTVSPRALRRIALGMQCQDIDMTTLFDSALCAGWSRSDIQMVGRNLHQNNIFTETFKSLGK